MPAIFVTATGTDVGKTYVTCAAVAALRRAGRTVDAYKPVLSGYTDYAGSDAALMLEALGRPPSDLDHISPLRFAAPLAPPSAARAEGHVLERFLIRHWCQERIKAAGETLLLIEGAGGVMSPIAETATNLDIIRDLEIPAILVAGTYLGAVSHTLTAIEAMNGVTIAAIVVSESEGHNPAPAEILSALANFAPDHRVVFAPRQTTWDSGDLIKLL